MQDNLLRLQKPIYKKSFDYGGMFNGQMAVHLDPDGGSQPYLAMATNGWNGGYGKRYSTLDEAKANLQRLANKL